MKKARPARRSHSLVAVIFREGRADSLTRLWSGQCLVLGYPTDLNLSLFLGHPVLLVWGTPLITAFSKPRQKSELKWVAGLRVTGRSRAGPNEIRRRHRPRGWGRQSPPPGEPGLLALGVGVCDLPRWAAVGGPFPTPPGSRTPVLPSPGRGGAGGAQPRARPFREAAGKVFHI